jgi:hypothetical protein
LISHPSPYLAPPKPLREGAEGFNYMLIFNKSPLGDLGAYKKRGLFRHPLFYKSKSIVYPKILNATVTPAITTETIDISLIRIFIEGPHVSLNGSPTVSPTILALWQSLFFPP